MLNEVLNGHHHNGTLMQKISFWMITMIHDNPLLPIFKDPYNVLEIAGLKFGQKVLEVGCGPGFYTIPAAHIVGKEGLVYAADINPYAIKRVRKKVEGMGIKNVVPMLTNASKTDLQDQSIDLVFMFGLPHIVGGQKNVLIEMNRILKKRGVIAHKKSRGTEEKIIKEMKQAGFIFSEGRGRILIFHRADSN